MKERLLEQAKDLLKDYYAAENIYPSESSIITCCVKQFYHLLTIPEVKVDAETIAAMVLDINDSQTASEVAATREFYFPTCPLEFENFSIKEIEAAQKDLDWM